MAYYQRSTGGMSAIKIVLGVLLLLLLIYVGFYFFVGKAVVGMAG